MRQWVAADPWFCWALFSAGLTVICSVMLEHPSPHLVFSWETESFWTRGKMSRAWCIHLYKQLPELRSTSYLILIPTPHNGPCDIQHVGREWVTSRNIFLRVISSQFPDLTAYQAVTLINTHPRFAVDSGVGKGSDHAWVGIFQRATHLAMSSFTASLLHLHVEHCRWSFPGAWMLKHLPPCSALLNRWTSLGWKCELPCSLGSCTNVPSSHDPWPSSTGLTW